MALNTRNLLPPGKWLLLVHVVLTPTCGDVHYYQCGLFHSLLWLHSGCEGVSNHQPYHCLLNRFFQAQIKENIRAPRHWPLCGKFTGDRWIPRTNGQLRAKCFHLMTSSWRKLTQGWLNRVCGLLAKVGLTCLLNMLLHGHKPRHNVHIQNTTEVPVSPLRIFIQPIHLINRHPLRNKLPGYLIRELLSITRH